MVDSDPIDRADFFGRMVGHMLGEHRRGAALMGNISFVAEHVLTISFSITSRIAEMLRILHGITENQCTGNGSDFEKGR